MKYTTLAILGLILAGFCTRINSIEYYSGHTGSSTNGGFHTMTGDGYATAAVGVYNAGVAGYKAGAAIGKGISNAGEKIHHLISHNKTVRVEQCHFINDAKDAKGNPIAINVVPFNMFKKEAKQLVQPGESIDIKSPFSAQTVDGKNKVFINECPGNTRSFTQGAP